MHTIDNLKNVDNVYINDRGEIYDEGMFNRFNREITSNIMNKAIVCCAVYHDIVYTAMRLNDDIYIRKSNKPYKIINLPRGDLKFYLNDKYLVVTRSLGSGKIEVDLYNYHSGNILFSHTVDIIGDILISGDNVIVCTTSTTYAIINSEGVIYDKIPKYVVGKPKYTIVDGNRYDYIYSNTHTERLLMFIYSGSTIVVPTVVNDKMMCKVIFGNI